MESLESLKKTVKLILDLLKTAYENGQEDIKIETPTHKGSIVNDTHCGISAQVTNRENGYTIVSPMMEDVYYG
jgi:hypothetical protein